MLEFGVEVLVLLLGYNMFFYVWLFWELEVSEFVLLVVGDLKVVFLVVGVRFFGVGVRFFGNGVFLVKLEGEVKEVVILGRMYEGME